MDFGLFRFKPFRIAQIDSVWKVSWDVARVQLRGIARINSVWRVSADVDRIENLQIAKVDSV